MAGQMEKVYGKLCLMQALYWAMFCSVSGFATMYMLDRGIGDASIGTIIAIACLISVFVQFGTGFLLDKFPKITIKKLIGFSMLLMAAINLLLTIFNQTDAIISVLYCLAIVLLYNIQPLMTSLVYDYENNGYHVSFSVTRGIGSGAYAIMSFILGALLAKYSSLTIPFVSMSIAIIVWLLLFCLPASVSNKESLEKTIEEEIESAEKNLFKKYPSLLPLLISITFIFTFHTITTIFLPQIMTRINSSQSQVGYAIAIAGAVEIPVMFGFKWLEKKFNVRNLLLASVIFFFIRSILYLLAGNFVEIIPAQLLQMLSFALITPAYAFYVNKMMSKKDNVKGQTFVMAAVTLGNVIGSFVGGQLISYAGVVNMLYVGILVTLIGLITMIFTLIIDKKQENA